MTDYIHIRRAPGTWVIRAGGAVLGESRNALELSEGGRAPVLYVPRTDIAMALLDDSLTSSTCPWKGKASYFSLSANGETIRDVAWSYETPKPGSEAIASHLAFYADKVTVEQL